MKNNIFISLLVAVLGLCYSCNEEAVPTEDSIVHDKTKVPTITSNSDLDAEMFVDATVTWDVAFEASNGIATISLNDSVIRTFGDGQLKYNGVKITMPDKDEYEVKLSVKDEIGLETIYPPFTIKAKGRLASSFLLCDFTTAATLVGADSERRPLFTMANAVQGNSGYSANAGWMDATIGTDLDGQTKLRYGAPAMNTANNADKWKHVSKFGVEAPLKDGSPVSALMIRHHFKDVAPDGNVTVTKWKPVPTFFLNKLVFDAPLLEPLVNEVVAGKRVVKIDIYVDTKSTADTDPAAKYNFNLEKHGMIALGMANVAKFNNTTSNSGKRSGQDHGMVAHISKTDQWETLTFTLDPANMFVHTKTVSSPENNEIDMFTLFVSAQTAKSGNVTNTPSNAKYYLSNLRVEKIDEK